MGNKIKLVILIIAGVILITGFMTILIPILADFASTANTTIAASSNWSDYPGAQGALIGAPLWLYFIPTILGIAAIVIVLRSKER